MKQINDETASRLIGLLDEFRRCLDKGGIVLDPDIVDSRIMEIDARIAELENADPVPDLELLKDPTAVCTMILRGTIAKPEGYERVDPVSDVTEKDRLIHLLTEDRISLARENADLSFAAMGVQRNVSSAILEVIEERVRQIEVKGWTSEHDDSHRPGALSDAGACYAMCGYEYAVPSVWPFDDEWWKPGGRHGRRKDLVKAAALIIAEIDRMDRASDTEAACKDGDP